MIPFTHKKLWVLQEEGSDVGAVSIPIGIKLRTGQKKEKGTSYAQNKQQGG